VKGPCKKAKNSLHNLVFRSILPSGQGLPDLFRPLEGLVEGLLQGVHGLNDHLPFLGGEGLETPDPRSGASRPLTRASALVRLRVAVRGAV
jgi:hypothetical protein